MRGGRVRPRAFAAFGAFLALALFGGARTSRAQNTYADVPSDPRSLFYRPDGTRVAQPAEPYTVPPPRSVVSDTNPRFIDQDPRPFMTPTVPGYPKYPPGAQYLWPGGLFYRQGHHWRRPPIPSQYFDYHRIAPRTQCWP
jgi:hypothetical protein